MVALLAHSDDELMCAGTLARFVDEGHNVFLVTAFDERPEELAASVEAIGCKSRVGFQPERDFCWSKRWVEYFEPMVVPSHTDLLISHRVEDDNTSHGHLGRIARTIARKNRMDLWEIDQTMPGGLTQHAQPNHWVNISDQIYRKRDALRAYRSVRDTYPGMWNAIQSRDQANGWNVGCLAAEGFTIYKSVWL